VTSSQYGPVRWHVLPEEFEHRGAEFPERGVALDRIEAELFAIAPGVAQPFIPGQQVRVAFDPHGIAVVRPD